MAAAPSTPDPAAETRAQRHLRMLAELADRGLALACDLQEAALAATDPQEKVRFAQGFHHVGRSVRQTIALEARQARELARDGREEAARGEARAAEATAVRKARVQAAVERLIWTELDPAEAEAWTADLAERLDDDALAPGFTDEAVEDHIERTARELGLSGEGTREYLPRALRRAGRFRRSAPARWETLLDELEAAEAADDAPAAAAPAAQAATAVSAPRPPLPPPRDPPAGPAPAPADAPAWEADFGPPPPALPPPGAVEPGPPPPDPAPDPPPAIAAPPEPPRPPPDPPPAPYRPPWEQLAPGAVFPGGSGY